MLRSRKTTYNIQCSETQTWVDQHMCSQHVVLEQLTHRINVIHHACDWWEGLPEGCEGQQGEKTLHAVQTHTRAYCKTKKILWKKDIFSSRSNLCSITIHVGRKHVYLIKFYNYVQLWRTSCHHLEFPLQHVAEKDNRGKIFITQHVRGRAAPHIRSTEVKTEWGGVKRENAGKPRWIEVKQYCPLWNTEYTYSMDTRDPVHMWTALMAAHTQAEKTSHTHTQSAFGSLYNSLCGCQLNVSALSTAHTHSLFFNSSCIVNTGWLGQRERERDEEVLERETRKGKLYQNW